MKMQYGGTEEEIRQLKEQEKLLKRAEEKFKSLDSDVKGPILTGLGSLSDCSETNDFSRFWQLFKDEFRNRNNK